MNRTLRRPMFRMGGSTGDGITSGLQAPRQGYVDAGDVKQIQDKKDLITEISGNVIAALLEYLEDNVSIQQDTILDPSNIINESFEYVSEKSLLASEIERLTILLKNYTESELYEKAAIIKNKLDKVFKKYKKL